MRAARIDQISGHRNRVDFIISVLERKIQRQEQIDALNEAAGCSKDEDHPELANGAEAYIRQLRDRSLSAQIGFSNKLWSRWFNLFICSIPALSSIF